MPLGIIVWDDLHEQVGAEAVANGDERPGARPRARDRRPAALHQDRRHRQHGLADRRRPLHRRALLRSGKAPSSRTSPRSGSSSRARCMPARFGPERSRHDLRPRGALREGADRPARAEPAAVAPACSSSASSTSTAPPRQMTVRLMDRDDTELWKITLEPPAASEPPESVWHANAGVVAGRRAGLEPADHSEIDGAAPWPGIPNGPISSTARGGRTPPARSSSPSSARRSPSPPAWATLIPTRTRGCAWR